ncbi:TatD family deoxyribonuclease, partial [Verminephrobacter sp. Larva24]
IAGVLAQLRGQPLPLLAATTSANALAALPRLQHLL